MYLPQQSALVADQSEFHANAFTTFLVSLKPSTGGWSSLIGVTTAIIGNILISFALNTQRYAHIRLGRDRAGASQEKRRSSRKGNTSTRTNATSRTRKEQAKIAEDRARLNAEAEADDRLSIDDDAHGDSAETDPLIPNLEESTSSDETVRADEDDNEAPQKEKSYLRSPIWWVGIALMVVGEAGNFLAYGFAPASIVSPLGVVALVSNCMIAPLLLGERFRWRDGIGVLIAIGGCVVVVLSASESNPKLDADAIWDLITRWEFETYFGISLFLIITLAVASNKFGERSIFIDLGLVGLFGGYTALSTKGIASLLSNKTWSIVTFPITYLLLAVLISTAVLQVKYVNRALQHFNATMVIPTQFVLFTLSVIIGSAILYRDFEREQTDDSIKFVCGCALTFFGVWCITSGHKKQSDSEDEGEDLDEDPDAILLVDDESVIPDTRLDGEDPTSHQAPALLRHHTLDAIPQAAQASLNKISRPEGVLATPLIVEPEGENPIGTASIAPGNAAAVHVDSAEEIHTDAQKPNIHATTSAPIIPTTATLQDSQTPETSLQPQTPLSRTISGPTAPDAKASTRILDSHADSPAHLDPTSSPHRLKDRHSVIGLFPGLLTSPLSNSLSAIVADELRRGLDKPQTPTGSMRHRSSKSIAVSKPAAAVAGAANGTSQQPRRKRHSIASGTERDFDREVLLNGLDGEDEGAIADSSPTKKPGRLRSLSATLGDIFGSVSSRSKRQQLDRTRTREGDDEQGDGQGAPA